MFFWNHDNLLSVFRTLSKSNRIMAKRSRQVCQIAFYLSREVSREIFFETFLVFISFQALLATRSALLTKKLLAALTKLHFILPNELFEEFFLETIMVSIFFEPPEHVLFFGRVFLAWSLNSHSTCHEDGFEDVVLLSGIWAESFNFLAKNCLAELAKPFFRCPESFSEKWFWEKSSFTNLLRL